MTEPTAEPKATAPAEVARTPYQQLKSRAIKSWFYSPQGFDKIEEFATGEAFLHSPLFGYPIRLSNWRKFDRYTNPV